jgi:O-antigen biosynthesis protein
MSALISILTPVHDPDPEHLVQMLASVSAQTFPDYEHCLVDDGSSDERVIAMLRDAASADPRLKLARREKAGGISDATNAALEMATGEFVALLDHDDTLVPEALEALAGAIRSHPGADFLYSDEVLSANGHPIWVHLKPDWSPDLFRSVMYTCHLSAYRRSLVDELGGLRSEFDGSQDYDLALRVSERTDAIVHIPRPLYNWRVHAESVTGNPNVKGYAYPAGQRALAEHLGRLGVDAEMSYGAKPGQYRVVHRLPPETEVAVVAPALGGVPASTLRRAGESWLRSSHRAWKLILVGSAATVAAWRHELPEELAGRVVEVDAPADAGIAAVLNRGAQATGAEQLILLEQPVEALGPSWVSRLAGYSAEPGVGAVAAKTLGPGRRIEHAGVVVSDGVPLPVLHGAPGSHEAPVAVTDIATNFSALSGTVATSREVLDALGGLDEELCELAVPDLCLRARERGLRVVSVPDAIVGRLEGAIPVNDLHAHELFRRRWRDRLGADPYLNPNYVRGRGDFLPRAGIA